MKRCVFAPQGHCRLTNNQLPEAAGHHQKPGVYVDSNVNLVNIKTEYSVMMFGFVWNKVCTQIFTK